MDSGGDEVPSGMDTKHKIINFGRIYHPTNEEVMHYLYLTEQAAMEQLGKLAKEKKDEKERRLNELLERGGVALAEQYQFIHARPDLQVSRGFIPEGFVARLMIEDGVPIYLETRKGGLDDRKQPLGPEFQISWKKERVVIGAGAGDGWNNSFDDLWSFVLAQFERKSQLSEPALNKLNVDPFILFGIDDPVSQQALQKLEKCAALKCAGATPTDDEWSQYLHIEPTNRPLLWLVHAFKETELPKPWTCYKGIGSIVCYIRADTGQVTWKHPFYEYFDQLRVFCKQASKEEIMQVRVNRLLWSYEATRVETEHDLEPLISPEYVLRLANIFDYEIKEKGFLVRNLKAQLKVFARTYRERQDIDIEDVQHCAAVLLKDIDKHREMCKTWKSDAGQQVDFELDPMANGKKECINCVEKETPNKAMCFCLECKDYLCLECFDKLHARGARREHAPFKLVPCVLCMSMPAKLLCTFTDKSFCHECYALRHIKTLPHDGKENHPRKIKYKQQYERYAEFAKARGGSQNPAPRSAAKQDQNLYESVLSTDWHPFYDIRGVKYYYNFVTGERMRQSPRREPNSADPGAAVDDEEEEQPRSRPTLMGDPLPGLNGYTLPGKPQQGEAPLALEGYDSLRTQSAVELAARLPDNRYLRPQHRMHMPNEVPPG